MGETVNVTLRVLKQLKREHEAYHLRDVPRFDNVEGLKQYLLDNHKEELNVAEDTTTFELGYCKGSGRFVIKTAVQLGEAYSLEKKGWITLYADPHQRQAKKSAETLKRTLSLTNSNDEDIDDDNGGHFSEQEIFQRLQRKHPEFTVFKLHTWAKMLTNGTHNSEDEPPVIPYFTGASRGGKRRCTDKPELDAPATAATSSSATKVSSNRTEILTQIKQLFDLKEMGAITAYEYEEKKAILLRDLN